MARRLACMPGNVKQSAMLIALEEIMVNAYSLGRDCGDEGILRARRRFRSLPPRM